jgi:glycosyltransferase involved in cell wall biosynthesis
MHIAIFDYKIIDSNPSGGCHKTLLRSLALEHDFTVFSVEFENPDPAHITWIRVPSPKRPLALLYLVFHALAPCVYILHRLRTKTKFDVIQSVESNLSFGNIVYSHFSHTSYLRYHHKLSWNLRGILRWIDHSFHSLGEQIRYPLARLLVTPSSGLAQELRREFPVKAGRLRVIPNPIHVKRMAPPDNFGSDAFRGTLGFSVNDFVFVFAALGQFERKGLPMIFESLRAPALSETKLLVIGGEADLVRDYEHLAEKMGIRNRIHFVGLQADVRPFFWCSDVFVLPSSYESFSLVTYEAAAAGLPIMAPSLNGICDLLRDGENGFLFAREQSDLTAAMERVIALPEQDRRAMGDNARRAASSFSEESFVNAWRSVYINWNSWPTAELQPHQGKFSQDSII